MDLVDHRWLGDEPHDSHGAVAGRAREPIDFEICWSRVTQLRVVSVGASRGAGTIASGVRFR